MRNTFLMVAVAAIGAAAPSPSASQAWAFPKGPAAKVGSSTISEKQVVGRIMQLLRQVSFHRRLTKPLLDKLRKEAIDRLIKEELLYREGRRLKLIPSDQEVDRARARMLAKTNRKKFGAYLTRLHMSWREHWLELRRRLTVRRVLQKLVVAPATLSDADVKTHYEKNLHRFKRPPEVKVRQILFRVPPSASPKTWRAAKAKAEATLAKLRAGADFDKLARSAAHKGSSHARGGHLGWIHKGRLVPEVEKVAFALQLGSVGGPIKTLAGYVLIKVDARRKERTLRFSEIAAKLKKELSSRTMKRKEQELYRRLRAQHKVHRIR